MFCTPAVNKSDRQSAFAMRDAAVDVDTGRTVILVEKLVRLLGRSRGFRVSADGSYRLTR